MRKPLVFLDYTHPGPLVVVLGFCVLRVNDMQCLTAEQLHQLELGNMPESAYDHVENCPQCLALFDSMPESEESQEQSKVIAGFLARLELENPGMFAPK